MRVPVEIETNAMESKLNCFAIYDDDETQTRLKWKQITDSDSKEESIFVLTYDKLTKVAKLQRQGSVASTLVFDPTQATIGTVDIGCGKLLMNIKTEYINPLSVMNSRFQISYEMESAGTDVIKNVFSVNLLLQNK